jgi:hypothetical protein
MPRMIRLLVPLALFAAGCPSNSPAPQILTFTATPSTIHAGEKSTLAWTVSGAGSVSIDPGLGAQTGSSVDVRPTATTTYTLTVSGTGQPATQTVIVTVLPAVPKPVITAFTASPSSAAAGSPVTLSWTVTGQIDTIVVTPGNIDVKAETNASGAGSHVLTSVTPPVTYTLTATNAGGSDTRTATVALSTGKHLQYTDPTSSTAKLRLVRNATSTDTHLVLDLKVGGTASVAAFGVAINIPFDPTSAGMLVIPANNALIPGVINYGSGPATAASLLGSASSAIPNVFTVGVAKKKANVADGDDTWAANATLFSIAFDMDPSAVAGTNVFTSAALNATPCAPTAPCAKYKATALHKDGTAAAAKAEIAIGDLIISP